MAACKPMQQAFVLQMAENPDQSRAEWARRAGYSAASDSALSVMAHRLSANPTILAALDEVMKNRLELAVPVAVTALLEIARDAGHRDRRGAAADLLKFAGLTPAQKVAKVVTHRVMSNPQMIEDIKRMGELMGIPIERLLGARAAGAIDADYEEVPVEDTEPLW